MSVEDVPASRLMGWALRRKLTKKHVVRILHLARSTFVRNVAMVTFGTAIAQAITVGFSPVITRLYGPEAFGILGIFLSLVLMIIPIASLAYEHAIVLPASDGDARALLRLSIYIGIGITLLSTVLFGVFHQQIGNALGFGAATLYLLLVPIVVLCSATAQPLQQWLIRKKQFRSISGVEISYATTMGVSKSGFGLIAATAPVLLVLNAIGYALQSVLLWLAARRTLFERFEPTERASLERVAHIYRDFPLYRAPQLLMQSISRNLPTIILAALFNPSFAGFYTLSIRVLLLPVIVISNSVAKVFLQHITEAAYHGERLRQPIIKTTGGLALIGLLPFSIVIVFGPQLFGLVFGADWITAGEYARWLALWLFVSFISTPCVQAIPILGLQAKAFVFETLLQVFSTGLFAFGAFVLASDIKAIAIFSIVFAIGNIGRNIWVIVRSDSCLREGFCGDVES